MEKKQGKGGRINKEEKQVELKRCKERQHQHHQEGGRWILQVKEEENQQSDGKDPKSISKRIEREREEDQE